MQKSSKELKNLKKHRHSNVCSSKQFYAFLGLDSVLAGGVALVASLAAGEAVEGLAAASVGFFAPFVAAGLAAAAFGGDGAGALLTLWTAAFLAAVFDAVGITGAVGLMDATVLATGDTGGRDALLPFALAADFAAATSAGFGVGTGANDSGVSIL